ncbi:MAG: hypothetical protein OXI95_11590 [bacterium]|nr:hypothetical protein [bacterium]
MNSARSGTNKDHRGGDGDRTPIDLERYGADESRLGLDCKAALAPLAAAAGAIAGIRARTGRRQPDVTT